MESGHRLAGLHLAACMHQLAACASASLQVVTKELLQVHGFIVCMCLASPAGHTVEAAAARLLMHLHVCHGLACLQAILRELQQVLGLMCPSVSVHMSGALKDDWLRAREGMRHCKVRGGDMC